MTSIRCFSNLLANEMRYFGRVGLSPSPKTVRSLAKQTHKSANVELALAVMMKLTHNFLRSTRKSPKKKNISR